MSDTKDFNEKALGTKDTERSVETTCASDQAKQICMLVMSHQAFFVKHGTKRVLKAFLWKI